MFEYRMDFFRMSTFCIVFISFVSGCKTATDQSAVKGFTIDGKIPMHTNMQPQDDGWSCGVHSSNRILNTYGLPISYHDQKRAVGSYKWKLGACKEIKFFGKKKKFCSPRLAVKFPIGLPPKKLKSRLVSIRKGAIFKNEVARK